MTRWETIVEALILSSPTIVVIVTVVVWFAWCGQ